MGTSSPTANLVVMAGAIHAAALLDLKFGRSLIVNPRTLMESSNWGRDRGAGQSESQLALGVSGP
jgi:hypothetical protein